MLPRGPKPPRGGSLRLDLGGLRGCCGTHQQWMLFLLREMPTEVFWQQQELVLAAQVR